jgi:hypothetical protein
VGSLAALQITLWGGWSNYSIPFTESIAMHMEQTTYNDIVELPTEKLFAAGVFVRYDSPTQVTLCYPTDLAATVREIMLPPPPAPAPTPDE